MSKYFTKNEVRPYCISTAGSLATVRIAPHVRVHPNIFPGTVGLTILQPYALPILPESFGLGCSLGSLAVRFVILTLCDEPAILLVA